MQKLTAWKFHCGLPKLLACGDSTGNIARVDQAFSELLHFDGHQLTAAIAQGMPECSVCTCMLVCVFFAHFCARERGCGKHPAFPVPSGFEGDKITAQL